MKSFRILAALALAAAIAGAVSPAGAQATISSPIIIKENAPKPVWLKAEVIHADAHSIMVREQGNSLAIHTFTYSPQIQDAMQQFTDQGGYQYGDKVKVLYQPGQTVALKITGKPSKPL
ncbi:MAG: hypothetical protein ABSE45_02170 [Candidatus Acidiferrales bacterium]|jgi:hypothetical protein